MQRLFSVFPAGRPGAALLLLRLSLGVLLVDGLSTAVLDLASPWLLLVPGAIAVALAIGGFTPVFAIMAIVLEVATLATTATSPHAIHVCAVLDAAAIALLGPGAYSLDARLFGRRRIVLSHEEPRRHQ